jgi:hypothetical protein
MLRDVDARESSGGFVDGSPDVSHSAWFRKTIRALTCTVIPEAAQLDEAGWSELERIIDESVGSRPPGLQRRLRIFLRLISWSAALRYGRPFHRLEEGRRERLLRHFEGHPIQLLRVGFWGVRTLVMMGYYAQTAIQSDMGYRPDPRGWDART